MSDSNSPVITLSSSSIDILINAGEHCLFKSFKNLQKIDADLAWVLLMDFTSSTKYHMPDPTLYGDDYRKYMHDVFNILNGTHDMMHCIRLVYRKDVYETHRAYKELLQDFKATVQSELAEEIFSEPYQQRLFQGIQALPPGTPFDIRIDPDFQEITQRYGMLLKRIANKPEKLGTFSSHSMGIVTDTMPTPIQNYTQKRRSTKKKLK